MTPILKRKEFLLILLILFLLFLNFGLKKGLEVNAFVGNILKIEDNSVSVKGMYLIPKTLEPQSGQLRIISAIITPETKIIRILKYLPSPEELRKTKGVYYPDNLEKEEKVVDKNVLIQDLEKYPLSIELKSDENIYNRNEFTVSEIKYEPPFRHKVRPSGKIP